MANHGPGELLASARSVIVEVEGDVVPAPNVQFITAAARPQRGDGSKVGLLRLLSFILDDANFVAIVYETHPPMARIRRIGRCHFRKSSDRRRLPWSQLIMECLCGLERLSTRGKK